MSCNGMQANKTALYEALKTIVWYDSHSEWLSELRNNINEAKKEGQPCYPLPFEVEEWHTEKHMIWMLLVGMFGDWGTSIRSGWIDDFDACIDFITSIVAEEEDESIVEAVRCKECANRLIEDLASKVKRHFAGDGAVYTNTNYYVRSVVDRYAEEMKRGRGGES